MENNEILFEKILFEGQNIKTNLYNSLRKSSNKKVIALAEDTAKITFAGDSNDSPPLSLTFIGQYNAGKSTIITALTGRNDIVIGSDVSTTETAIYDWYGMRLVDTPGIKAGHPEHDEITYREIDRSDLLIFVITTELFDDLGGKNFRKIAFDMNKAREILLVVNKMSADPGIPEIKRFDIEKVTSPMKCEDFYTTFIDAKSYLDALKEEDDIDRKELFEIANLDDLKKSINNFIGDRELQGRLSNPIFTLRAIAEQAKAYLSISSPEEEAVIELLNRKYNLLLSSREKLRLEFSSLINRALIEISTLGDKVAESVEPGTTQKDMEQLNQSAQMECHEVCKKLSKEISQYIEREDIELNKQLEILAKSSLSQKLLEMLSQRNRERFVTPQTDTPMFDKDLSVGTPSDWPAQIDKIGNVAKNIGNRVTSMSIGSKASTVKPGSVIASSGSQAHRIVYDVGKFFGVKFKPWGAVKAAKAIGNAGRAIAAVGGLLAVLGQIAEDKAQEENRKHLRVCRDGIRSAYRDWAFYIQNSYLSEINSFFNDVYDIELNDIDKTVRELIQEKESINSEAKKYKEIAETASNLISRINKD